MEQAAAKPEAHDPACEAENEASNSRAADGQRELLERITQFTLKHELNVSGMNLATICKALSGASSVLAQAFLARELSGDPIDQRWLDSVARLDPETNGRVSELESLMDKLEYSLMRFAQTARSAHIETQEHRGAIDAKVEAIAGAKGSSDDVDRVIDLSRAMLDQVEQLETAMLKSQSETEDLRQDLAKARIEADVDHLTGLPNRRAFERRLSSAAIEAEERSQPLCIAFCDVDHFKLINDKHGHDAGDRILCSLASTFSKHAGDDCFVARHGGEEFVILFLGKNKDDSWLKLEAIRRAQARKQLLNRETGLPFGKVTFSAGIADVQGTKDTRNALARADEALYQAKAAGRNKIIVS